MTKHVKASTKKIAIVAVFAALTIAFNLSPLKLPAPYAPYLIYQVWEIPIVTAFLIYGFITGVIIAIVNTLVLLIVFPGALPTGPLYNLAAIISMLFGLALPKMFHKNPKGRGAAAAVLTVFGIIFRVVIMTVVCWVFLRFPPPVGYAMPEEAILLTLPLIAFFNATLALYAIPLGYTIAETIKRHVKA